MIYNRKFDFFKSNVFLLLKYVAETTNFIFNYYGNYY
jgi:hypothetical protein